MTAWWTSADEPTGRQPRQRALPANQSGGEAEPQGRLPAMFEKLLPLHTRLAPPQPGDWLAEHKEPGQSYSQYLRGRPIRVDRRRRVIYVQPLGEFDSAQRKVLDRTTEFLGIYFQLPVKIREDLSLDLVPAKARREHPTWHVKQILSTYVLDEVLRPRLPADACAYIALTTSDLWPGQGWNFVFGQASLTDRVGVWSIARNGDPHGGGAAFRLCLLRTLKTASHETGHMFSIKHCTLYECNMCGSNHREESDRRPLWLCPHCLAKLWHATGADPVRRFKDLVAFSSREGLKPEKEFYEKSLALLEEAK
ncbi:MAG: archaemetzincin [Thermoguttaceae bacterium]|jgi:archaemetzincin